jgi:hypothetical protein
MNTAKLKNYGYSAKVQIQLFVNGQVFPVAQLGPDFLVLRESTNHPPAEAEISMSVDGRESRWPVRLVDGIAVDQWKTRIARPQER